MKAWAIAVRSNVEETDLFDVILFYPFHIQHPQSSTIVGLIGNVTPRGEEEGEEEGKEKEEGRWEDER